MKTCKLLIRSILCFSCFFVATASFAGDGYILKDGTRAEFAERQLFLFDRDSKRSFAPPGVYETIDGRYVFIVKKNKRIEVRDKTTGNR